MKEIGTVEEGINRNEQGESYTEQGTRNKKGTTQTDKEQRHTN